MGAPRGDTGRLFVLERRGSQAGTAAVRLVDLATNTVLPTPFLAIDGLMTVANDTGLLGWRSTPTTQRTDTYGLH